MINEVKAGGAYVEITGRDDELARTLASGKQKVEAFASQVESMGKRMIGISAAILAPMTAGALAAAELEKNVANIGTLLSEADRQKFLPSFKDRLRELSREIGEGTETLSKALFDIVSAGIDPGKALDVLEASAKGAVAGVTQTGIAADAITTILNSYKMSAEKASSVADFLFSVNLKGKTTFEQVAGSIGNVAATASVAGLSLEELGALISTLTRNGLNTAEAITSVSAILRTFLSPQDESVKAAREYGIELNTMTLRTEGLLGVLQKLQGVSPETIAQIFPETRALKGIAVGLQDVVGFGNDIGTMYNRQGAAERAYQQIAATTSKQIDQVVKGFRDLAVQIGEAVLPITTEAVNRGKGLIEWAIEFVRENDSLVRGFAKLAIWIGTVGSALLFTGLSIKGFIAILGSLPIVAVVAGLTLIAAAAYAMSDGVQDAIDTFVEMEGIKGPVGDVLKWLKDQFTSLVDWIDEKMTVGVNVLEMFGVRTAQVLIASLRGVVFVIRSVFDSILDFIANRMADLVETVADTLRIVNVGGATGGLVDQLDEFTDALRNDSQQGPDGAIGNAIDDALQTAEEFWSKREAALEQSRKDFYEKRSRQQASGLNSAVSPPPPGFAESTSARPAATEVVLRNPREILASLPTGIAGTFAFRDTGGVAAQGIASKMIDEAKKTNELLEGLRADVNKLQLGLQ